MGRIRSSKFEGFISRGATKPFIVEDDAGDKWVVKALGNPFGTQAIFNEYVAGSLATLIGLPWPRPFIVELSPDVLETLRNNKFNVTSKFAVGAEYIRGLKPIDFPDHLHVFDPNFKSDNATFIRQLFPDHSVFGAFYGKSVFDNWVVLHDTKYDTLHVSPDGNPIFLDATFAFGYIDRDWDEGKVCWNETALNLELSPYLNGIVVDTSEYDSWIDRIAGISTGEIDSILHIIPHEWGVPNSYFHMLRRFLVSGSEIFVPLFRNYLEFLNLAG